MVKDCIFCKIIRGEIPAEIIFRDENIIAFHDINPKAPVHFLVLPVVHIESIRDLKDEDSNLMGELMLGIKKIAQKVGIDKTGYKVIANNGILAGQLVLHLHFHVLGKLGKVPHWQI